MSDIEKYSIDSFEIWLKVYPYTFELKKELQKAKEEIIENEDTGFQI